MNATAEDLYGMLVPLSGMRLLVPRGCVAEVVVSQQLQSPASAPLWYLGSMSWGDRKLPVISFEAACGNSLPIQSSRARVIVCVAITDHIGAGYFGLVSQGFPQLVKLGTDLVKPDPSSLPFGSRPILSQVRFINETALIPDFEQLELMIGREMPS